MDREKYCRYAGEIDPSFGDLYPAMEAIEGCLVSSVVNVTAIRDADGILSLHIIDSLRAAALLRELCPPGGTLCDVGSGGGFPALPVAAALPDVSVTAMDSTAKKCRYIEDCARRAGIANVTALCARAEECGELFGSFDAVCARAVAALPVLCELCAPLVKVGGYFVAMKGERAAEEAESAARGAEILGLSEERRVDYSLPEGGDHRTLIVYRKVRETPAGYPREYRRIVKAPLGV